MAMALDSGDLDLLASFAPHVDLDAKYDGRTPMYRAFDAGRLDMVEPLEKWGGEARGPGRLAAAPGGLPEGSHSADAKTPAAVGSHGKVQQRPDGADERSSRGELATVELLLPLSDAKAVDEEACAAQARQRRLLFAIQTALRRLRIRPFGWTDLSAFP